MFSVLPLSTCGIMPCVGSLFANAEALLEARRALIGLRWRCVRQIVALRHLSAVGRVSMTGAHDGGARVSTRRGRRRRTRVAGLRGGSRRRRRFCVGGWRDVPTGFGRRGDRYGYPLTRRRRERAMHDMHRA